SKGQTWPNKAQQRLGVRLLNPCREVDYGEHIFEDPKTHELVGVTPPGRYHIIVCDLNAAHLVRERRDRAKIKALLDKTPVTLVGTVQFDLGSGVAGISALKQAIEALREELSYMIPPIPAPPIATA